MSPNRHTPVIARGEDSIFSEALGASPDFRTAGLQHRAAPRMLIIFNPTAGLRRVARLWRVLDVMAECGMRLELAETRHPISWSPPGAMGPLPRLPAGLTDRARGWA
jgi:hypothetical protein